LYDSRLTEPAVAPDWKWAWLARGAAARAALPRARLSDDVDVLGGSAIAVMA
jgi:hypothetical protein